MVKTIVDSETGYVRLNLSQGVGPGRANNIDDVTYIQYLLNQIVQHPRFTSIKSACKSNGAKLAVDGIIGPKTRAQIKAFQLHFKSEGWGNMADGCVDTIRGQFIDKKAGFYTLSLFDWALLQTVPGELISTNSLLDRPDFPPRLKAIAMVVRNQNDQLVA
jgi:peptidoglycan hydrolase-like protein with peptidoglycan-binding domain